MYSECSLDGYRAVWNGNTSRAGVANMRFDIFRVRDENKVKNQEKGHKGRK